MQHKFFRFHIHVFTWRSVVSEDIVALILALFIFVVPTSAAMRFQERSLYIQDNEPGVTSSYTLSWRYMSPQPVGSVDILFCNNPIPYEDCVKPAGFDASSAVLSEQLGEVGFSILSKSANHIVLSRPPGMISALPASYTFDNIVNPTDSTNAFAVRLRSHASINATGPQIDFGSVRGQVASGIVLQTQVPPMLIFCVAEEVSESCTQTSENNYTDMGQLNARSTLLAQSQMAVGTNASGGFAITANGDSMAAGTNVIDSMTTPAQSVQGINQFGINLVENDAPSVGSNPEGDWANAVPAIDYSIPNQYKYVSGDVVAYSPNVSLMKKFTVSYIVNSSPTLKAGVYTTTISYIASGRF